MKKRSLIISLMAIIMTMIPTFAFAMEAEQVKKYGNILLSVGCGLLALLVFAMAVFGKINKDE